MNEKIKEIQQISNELREYCGIDSLSRRETDYINSSLPDYYKISYILLPTMWSEVLNTKTNNFEYFGLDIPGYRRNDETHLYNNKQIDMLLYVLKSNLSEYDEQVKTITKLIEEDKFGELYNMLCLILTNYANGGKIGEIIVRLEKGKLNYESRPEYYALVVKRKGYIGSIELEWQTENNTFTIKTNAPLAGRATTKGVEIKYLVKQLKKEINYLLN